MLPSFGLWSSGLFLMVTLLPAPAAQLDSGSIDGYLSGWADANGVPGAAVAILDGDEVDTYMRGTDGDGRPVTSDTPFLVGSVAKTMTSAVVLRLVAEDRIGIDEPVSAYLPWLEAPDMSVRQLLTHTSGYRMTDGVAVSERYVEGADAIRQAAEDLEHTGQVGEYEYNSADYLVLGALVEEVTGQPYAEAAERMLFSPLRMDATTAAGGDGLPPGHRLWWGRPRSYDPGFDDSGAPYASVMSTLDDLVAYARAALDGELLPSHLVNEAWSIQAVTGEDRGYGLGWSIDESGEAPVVHHTGATPGYFAHVWLVPSKDRAVVVLANAYAEARAPSLVSAASDIDAIAHGERAAVRGGDPVLTAMPWLLLVPAVVGVVATLPVRRYSRRRRRLIAVVAAVSTALVLAALPWLTGYGVRFLWTWMPDILAALVVSALVLLTLAGWWSTGGHRRGDKATQSP